MRPFEIGPLLLRHAQMFGSNTRILMGKHFWSMDLVLGVNGPEVGGGRAGLFQTDGQFWDISL